MIDNFVRLVVKSNDNWIGNSMAGPKEPLNAEADPWRAFEGDDRDIVERFRSLQKKLIFFFERQRCSDPEELADETLERVVRKMCEGTEIQDLLRYSYGVAKNVFREYVRREKAKHKYLDDQRHYTKAEVEDDVADKAAQEQRLQCLEECKGRFNKQDYWILYEYYRYNGQRKLEHRRKMAEELKITRAALTLRVFHLKQRLRRCIDECLENS